MCSRLMSLRDITNRGTPIRQSVVRGVSGQGWDYNDRKTRHWLPQARLSLGRFCFCREAEQSTGCYLWRFQGPLVSTYGGN